MEPLVSSVASATVPSIKDRLKNRKAVLQEELRDVEAFEKLMNEDPKFSMFMNLVSRLSHVLRIIVFIALIFAVSGCSESAKSQTALENQKKLVDWANTAEKRLITVMNNQKFLYENTVEPEDMRHLIERVMVIEEKLGIEPVIPESEDENG